ncbi:MAG: hypothetical protein WC901_05230 [Candidatus Margulisiibacteriota bacterium]
MIGEIQLILGVRAHARAIVELAHRTGRLPQLLDGIDRNGCNPRGGVRQFLREIRPFDGAPLRDEDVPQRLAASNDLRQNLIGIMWSFDPAQRVKVASQIFDAAAQEDAAVRQILFEHAETEIGTPPIDFSKATIAFSSGLTRLSFASDATRGAVIDLFPANNFQMLHLRDHCWMVSDSRHRSWVARQAASGYTLEQAKDLVSLAAVESYDHFLCAIPGSSDPTNILSHQMCELTTAQLQLLVQARKELGLGFGNGFIVWAIRDKDPLKGVSKAHRVTAEGEIESFLEDSSLFDIRSAEVILTDFAR